MAALTAVGAGMVPLPGGVNRRGGIPRHGSPFTGARPVKPGPMDGNQRGTEVVPFGCPADLPHQGNGLLSGARDNACLPDGPGWRSGTKRRSLPRPAHWRRIAWTPARRTAQRSTAGAISVMGYRRPGVVGPESDHLGRDRDQSCPGDDAEDDASAAWSWAPTTTSPSRSALARCCCVPVPSCGGPTPSPARTRRSPTAADSWSSTKAAAKSPRGHSAPLTATEWKLFTTLASVPGRVCSRYELINRTRG